MLGVRLGRALRPSIYSPASSHDARRTLSTSKRLFDPLRILFCGSDDFSNYSLRALHQLKEESPEAVSSIDVVCRPDKRTGRGLKNVQEGMEQP